MYGAGHNAFKNVGEHWESSAGTLFTDMKDHIVNDISRSLSDSLVHIAEREVRLRQTPQKRSESVEQDIPSSETTNMLSTILRRDLSTTIANNTLMTLMNNLNRLSSPPDPPPPPPSAPTSASAEPQKPSIPTDSTSPTLKDTLTDTIASLLINGSATTTTLQLDTRPILTQTLRSTVNALLNAQMTHLRTGFDLPSWMSLYATQWCWGTFARRGAKRVTGCTDASALADIDLAPGLRQTLKQMEVGNGVRTPERVDLPAGLQRSLDGVGQFTHGVFAANIAQVVLAGITALVSGANVFVVGSWTQTSDFFVLGMCAASAIFTLLVLAPYAVFEYFNGLALPGILSLANIGYENGWAFVSLFVVAECLTLLAMGCWIVLERKGYRDKLLEEDTGEIFIAKRDTQPFGMGMPVEIPIRPPAISEKAGFI
jgi:hypothetical protein